MNQKASHEPSGQYALNDEYYKRIEAIQFTMNHDDGNQTSDIEKSDIILLGVDEGCGYEISDIRDDGDINILDIITLVQYVLYGELPGDNAITQQVLLVK